MVLIQRPLSTDRGVIWKRRISLGILLILSTFFLYKLLHQQTLSPSSPQLRQRSDEYIKKNQHPEEVFFLAPNETLHYIPKCPYRTLNDLTPEERYPQQGDRHMVNPPKGGKVTLVCCETTAGPLNIVARNNWAPLGAARFLEMVSSGYFSTSAKGVPLMRCVKGFLCQFGLAGDPVLTKKYDKNLKDDVNWLPEGSDHRQNPQGVKRFAHGYMAYAGAGPNTRSNQFIVSLKASGPLAGGSPWEVPWGEVVGESSFQTLAKIYTGYGEKGPSQGILRKEGASEQVQHMFSKLDYITSCDVVDHEVQTGGG